MLNIALHYSLSVEFKVSKGLQIGLCAQFQRKGIYLLSYKTFYLGSSYSAAYNSYHPVIESNCLQFCIWQ